MWQRHGAATAINGGNNQTSKTTKAGATAEGGEAAHRQINSVAAKTAIAATAQA